MRCGRLLASNACRLPIKCQAVYFPSRRAMAAFERIIWIVLDSVGIGELPDAAEFGDGGRNTLGHIAESHPLNIPNLAKLGLANIAPLKNLQPAAAPFGAYGKRATPSPGKDTTTRHSAMV